MTYKDKNVILLSLFLLLLSSLNAQKIELSILAENTSTIQAMQVIEPYFEEQNPGIDLIFKPNTFDDAFSKSNEDFENGTSLYDIVIQYNFSLSSFVQNDYVYLLDELKSFNPGADYSFEEDLFDNYWLELGQYYKNVDNPNDGYVMVGYPSAALTMLLMYNKDLYENPENKIAYKKEFSKELNPPENWEDYYNQANFFTNKEKETYGVCIEGGPGGFLYFELMNFIGNKGGKVMDKSRGWQSTIDTEVTVSSDEVKSALAFYKSLKPFNKGSFHTVEQFEQMKIMKEGKTAMAMVWSDMIYPNIKTQDGFDKRFGFVPVPGQSSILGGGAFFVNKKTKHPKEISLLISFMNQYDTQLLMAKNGLCSPNKLVYNSSELKEIPYAKALQTSLSRATITLEAGPESSKVSDALTSNVQAFWDDKITLDECVKNVENEISSERDVIFKNINNSNNIKESGKSISKIFYFIGLAILILFVYLFFKSKKRKDIA